MRSVKLLPAILLVALFFLLLPLMVSVFYVDESIKARMGKVLKNGSCSTDYTRREVNLLNPFEFYANTEYWLSDYRLSDSYVTNPENINCLMLVIREARDIRRHVRIAFVSEYGVVSSQIILRRIK